MKSILTELKEDTPCAVIGTMPTIINDALKEVTSAIEVPHVLYWQVHQHLSSPRHSKNIISPIVSPKNVADIVLEYLSGTLNSKGVAIIHENPDLSADLAEEFVNYGPKYGMQNYAFKRWSHDTTEDLDNIILDIQQYGLKTIFLNILSKEKTIPLAESLERHGMLDKDSGYLYIVSTNYIKLDSLDELYGETSVNSVWDKLLSNPLVFDEHMDNFRASEDDRFLQAWRKQNATFVEHLNSIHPVQSSDSAYYYKPSEDDYFQTNNPSYRASFTYDAVMSIGLGACQAQLKSDNKETIVKIGDQRRLQPPPPDVSNNKVHSAMVDLEFNGATDFVQYDIPGSRTKASATVGIYNIRPVPSSTITTTSADGEPTHHSYEAILTNVYKSKTGWSNVPDANFIYKDGSTNHPPLEREVQEQNYLSSWVRALGFSFMNLTWLMSILCSIGICIYRKSNAVRGGQPFFLQLICASSIIMGTSILTLSFDEGSGWSTNSLSVACSLTPWFFIIGQILMVSCMWSKLWRINKVMQFRRQKVTIRAAMTPIFVILIIALVILISWSVVDPWVWERVKTQDYPLETYGVCTCNNFWAWFGPLISLVVFSSIMVLYYAYKSLDISEELGDSRAIFFTMFTQIEAWAIGIPILIAVSGSSADGTYLARVVLIFVFAFSPLIILICPKIYQALYPNQKTKRGNVSTSGRSGGAVVHTSGLSAPVPTVSGTNVASSTTNRVSSTKRSSDLAGSAAEPSEHPVTTNGDEHGEDKV